MNDIYKTPSANLNTNIDILNNSGGGKGIIVPDNVKGWSWGAFFLTWIWGIGNKTWFSFLTLLPYVGLVFSIILGFKGREWAWRNKRWESFEHFEQVQKRWSFWGVTLVLGVAILGIVAAIAIPAYQDYVARSAGM